MNKIYLIAEIAQAHDGSLGIAHSYIDALKDSGVDAIKFQTHIAIAESSEFETFRVNFSYEDQSRFDYWKRMEFTLDQWDGLKKHCDEVGLEFISSPFSNAAVDLLENIGITKYKIGSGEVNNHLLLEKIARTGKPVILSSGMSDWNDLDAAIDFFKPFGTEVSLLQCTTAYPTVAGQWGIILIPEMIDRYNIPIGFSDHSGTIYPCIAAAALGAKILEFHVVFDKKMFGPDTKASISINEVRQIVDGARAINKDISFNHKKSLDHDLLKLRKLFGKSLAVNKEMNQGSLITFEDLEAKKPEGYGIDAKLYKNVLGKTIKNDLKANSFLNFEDLT